MKILGRVLLSLFFLCSCLFLLWFCLSKVLPIIERASADPDQTAAMIVIFQMGVVGVLAFLLAIASLVFAGCAAYFGTDYPY